MKPKRLGEVTVQSITEWSGPYRDPLRMYPEATPEIVARHRPWMEPECFDGERMIFAFQSFLVRAPRQTVLIDCCVGNDKDRPGRPDWHRKTWPWMDNLRTAGVQPEEIDVVLCTHLHVDHVGWNTRLENGRWVPTFPNARYLFGRTEYEHWSSVYKEQEWMTAAFEDSVVPIMESGQAVLIDEGHELEAGLWVEETPGHTPGSACLHVHSKDRKAVFTGDMMHHPIQVPEPQLSSIFCWDPARSRETRTAFLERHAETGAVIIPAHFPGRTAGTVVRDGEGLMFEFSEE